MRKIKEVIVVEGRYDKNTLASRWWTPRWHELGGFAVFNTGKRWPFSGDWRRSGGSSS